MENKMKSRKFWMAMMGALLPVVAALLSASMTIDQAVMESVAVVCAYIFGQGYVDAAALKRTSEAPSIEVKEG